MENQHRMISGYRELSREEINLMNDAKQKEVEVIGLVKRLEDRFASEGDSESLRWLAIAKTDIQKGFMALIRSIAKPGR